MQGTLWGFFIANSAHRELSLAGVVEHQIPHVVSKLTKSIAKRNCPQDRGWRGF